jgi:hypothetical protein
MALSYLIFDHSEDTEGIGTFEAMASVSPDHLAAVKAEVALVLAWATSAFPDGRGPLDQGFEWDHDLQEQHESPALHTVTLLLCGGGDFCHAFSERFADD